MKTTPQRKKRRFSKVSLGRTQQTYRGRVRGGVIVLDEKLKLPEGTHVVVQTEQPMDLLGIAGSWVDSRSAEEIVKEIRRLRRSK